MDFENQLNYNMPPLRTLTLFTNPRSKRCKKHWRRQWFDIIKTPMFICKIFIGPGGVGQVYDDILKGNLEKFASEFTQFNPSVDALNHFVEFKNVDRNAVAKFEKWLREQSYDFDPKCDLGIEERHTESELFSAEYVPLTIDGDYIDVNKKREPLNHPLKMRCQTCFLPEEGSVSNPYVVSEDNVRTIQDVYWAHDGVIIVSQRLMSALGRTFMDNCQYGEVTVRESSRAKRLQGSFFWLRPKHSLGKEHRSKVLKSCEVCGAPIKVHKIDTGDKFLDAQIVLEQCSYRSLDIALSGNWYGERTKAKPMSVTRDVYISGKLFFLLHKQGVKGLVKPSNVIVTK